MSLRYLFRESLFLSGKSLLGSSAFSAVQGNTTETQETVGSVSRASIQTEQY